MRLPAPNEQETALAGIPDDELDLIRRRYRLTPHSDATAWALYDRAKSVWRQRCSEWLIRLMQSPRGYAIELGKRKAARDRCEPSEVWLESQTEAAETVRGQLMDLALVNQSAGSLALEILGEDGSPRSHGIIRELCQGGWLPRPPQSPRDGERRDRERRAGITDDQRMKNAESVF